MHDISEKNIFEPIERPITPGITYVADRFRDAIYYDTSTTTVQQKQKKAFDIFNSRLELFEEDLQSDNDASLTLGVLSQILDFSNREARMSAVDFVERNFANIAKRLTSENLKDNNDIGEGANTLRTLTYALERLGVNDEKSNKYFQLLSNHQDEILDTFRKRYSFGESVATMLFCLRQKLNPEDRGQIDLLIKGLLFFDGAKEMHTRRFIERMQEFRPNLVYMFYVEELEKYIPDEDTRRDIVRSLQVSSIGVSELNNIEIYRSLRTCQEIDQQIPGGCEKLNSIFGITHFGRYPSNLLIEQLNDWDKKDRTPYGALIGSWGDWNNAISGEEKNIDIATKVRRLGFKTRVIEARNKKEFVARQIALRERYKGAGKFHFLNVHAHGEPSGFRLGDGVDGFVGIDDIPSLKTDLAQLYGPSMQTFFFSCSTGVENGFAEKWADSRIESIAPDRDTGIDDVEVFDRPGGLLGFRVKYHKAIQNRYPN